MKKFFVLFAASFILNILIINADPLTVIYVSSTGGGIKDGSSWANAYDNTQLQTAIDNCPTGGQVWVASGTYKPTSWPNGGSGPRFMHFSMKDGVAIFGGLVGNEISSYDMANRNISSNETILSGDIGTIGDNTDNCFHVIKHNSYRIPILTNSAVLDGFTIRDGNDNITNEGGGGLNNLDNSPIIRNCNFTNNNSSSDGGAIYIMHSNGTSFINCSFNDNNSSSSGGAIYDIFGTHNFENCIFKNNFSYRGGALLNIGGFSSFINCAFFDNTTSGDQGDGGAIWMDYGLTFTNCTIAGNNASSLGGGLYSFSGYVTLNNTIIWGNIATVGGNQFAQQLTYGMITLNNCDFSNESGYEYNTNIVATGCINSDPLFVGGGNYSLQSGSPCIDIGDNSYNTTSKDLANHTRIHNSTIDLGAYEFQNLSNSVASIKLLINRGVRSYNGSCATTNGICSIEIVPTNASNGNADLVVEAEARHENGRLNITVTSDNFDAALYNSKHRAEIRFVTNTTLDASIAASFGLSELTLAKGTYSFGGKSGIRTSIKLVQNR